MSIAAAINQPTPTELSAHARRLAFRARIAAKAAELAERKPVPPAPEAVPTPAPRAPAAVTPLALPVPPMKPPWFSIEGATLVRQLRIRDIQLAVCDRQGLTLTQFLSERRHIQLVRARQVAMYLCKELTGRSLPEIGRSFGGKDHTTILHGWRKIRLLIGQDPAHSEVINPEIAELVKSLRDELESRL